MLHKYIHMMIHEYALVVLENEYTFVRTNGRVVLFYQLLSDCLHVFHVMVSISEIAEYLLMETQLQYLK